MIAAGEDIEVENPEPKWVRVAERIVNDIESGKLRIGGRLPSERDLCVRLDVSRVTLRRAFASLEEQGVLRPSRGRGWYVAGRARRDWPGQLESFSGAAHRLGGETSAAVVDTRYDPAGTADAEAFGVEPGEPIMTFARLRLLDGEPAALELIRVAKSMAPGDLAEEHDDQRFMVVLAEAGYDITGASGMIGAIAASAEHARLLKVDEGTPLATMTVEITGEGRLLVESRLIYVPEHPLRVSFG